MINFLCHIFTRPDDHLKDQYCSNAVHQCPIKSGEYLTSYDTCLNKVRERLEDREPLVSWEVARLKSFAIANFDYSNEFAELNKNVTQSMTYMISITGMMCSLKAVFLSMVFDQNPSQNLNTGNRELLCYTLSSLVARHAAIAITCGAACEEKMHLDNSQSSVSENTNLRNINSNTYVFQVQKDGIEVRWSDGHLSSYDASWLQRRQFTEESREREKRWSPRKPRIWDHTRMQDNVPTDTFERVW